MKLVSGEATCEIIINKSKFIGYLCEVHTEEEAIDKLNKRRKVYLSATHNCYAYIIGRNSGIMRYSDDGEPQGTAGVPILEVLRKNEVTDVLAVVTRYFGGILLGAGGLVRAYTKTCAEVLSLAQVYTPIVTKRYEMDFSYSAWPKAEHFLTVHQAVIERIDFTHRVDVTFVVPVEHASAVDAFLNL